MIAKDVVFVVDGAVCLIATGTGFVRRKNLDADLVVEEELIGVGNGSAVIGLADGAVDHHLHVDVDGAIDIPTGIDRVELDEAGISGNLNAAPERRRQMLLADAGVKTLGVAVPVIDGSVGERRTGGDVLDTNAEFERDARNAFGDVLPDQIAGEEIRSFRRLYR